TLTHLGHQIGSHRLSREHRARSLLDRKLLTEICAERIELPLSLRERRVRLQPSNDAQRDVRARSGREVLAADEPDIRRDLGVGARRQQELEARREHADDLHPWSAEVQDLTHHRRIRAEATLPELIT